MNNENTTTQPRVSEQVDEQEIWQPMLGAPKDGTMLRLLVRFDDNATEDSADPCPTIGANNLDNDGVDKWQFAGWDWSHDCFTEGTGTPIGWLPIVSRASLTQQAAPEAPTEWRCFHCEESFTDRDKAALHFGTSERQAPMCSVNQEQYREMERRMVDYNAEDADIHRQMHRQHNDHARDLRRGEEEGYARGLRDAPLISPVAAPEAPAETFCDNNCLWTDHHPDCSIGVSTAATTASTRDWTEDAAHENGNYLCVCSTCGNTFAGYKRRVTCKACDAATTEHSDDCVACMVAVRDTTYHVITRDEFEPIRQMLETARKKTRPRGHDLYDIFCTILYRLRTGTSWRSLPPGTPPWRTVHEYHQQWSMLRREGTLPVLQRALETLGLDQTGNKP